MPLGLCALALLAGGPARAAAARASVVVAVLESWPPEYSLDPAGRPTGFAVDVFQAVAERADLAVSYRVERTFSAAIADLDAGKVDVIPNLGITPDRLPRFAFTTPVETFAITLWARTDTRDVRGLDSLRGRPVAVVETNAATALLGAREREGLRLVRFPDVHTALFALLAGQVDALAYPAPVIRGLAESAGLADRIREVGQPLAEIKRAIAVRRGDSQLLARLDRAVRELEGTPEFQKIYARWYGREPRRDRGWVAWALGATLAVALLAFVFWRYRVVIELRANRESRERAEAELRETSARLQAIAENLGEGLMVGDFDGRVTYVNSRFLRLTGFSREECLGRPAARFLHPGESPEQIGRNLERRKRGISDRYDVQLLRKGGSGVWVEVHASPLIDADGRVAGSLAAMIDISERKRAEAELREKEAELLQAQKMEAVGRMAGGVAHDFNNLLTAITGYSELLLAALEPGDVRREYVEQVRRAGDSAAALTRQLLAFSRRQVLQPKPVDLNELVARSEQMLRRVIEERIEVITELEPGLEPVLADPVQLEQVLLNLVVNARDAMPDGGTLTVRTWRRERGPGPDPGRDGGPSEPGEGPQVVLEVRDTGTGMDAETLSRIFEPFFTTKETGRGTGLGLSTVYGIVQQTGGSVEVDSEPERGTSVTVFLPAIEGDAEPGRRTPPPPSAEIGGEQATILVVEDDPVLRKLEIQVLSQAGFTVLDAEGGPPALELVRERGDRPVELLVTDLVMPKMRGEELAERLRSKWPGLKVLFTSGYASRAVSFDELRTDEGGFLPKPFSPDLLVRSVRRLLGRISD